VKKRGLELAMVDIFSNLNSFLLAFFSVAFAVVFLGFESHRDRAFLMRDLGIPTGLIGSLIGMVQAITCIGRSRSHLNHQALGCFYFRKTQ
jgi:hypothetical protein